MAADPEFRYRKCPACKENKPRGQFGLDKSSPNGLATYCRACFKLYRQANPRSQTSTDNSFYTYIEKSYGLTREEYDGLKARQGNLCAICNGPSPDGRRLHIDHDHQTGKVRGLLCVKCNVGLGAFKDQPTLLENAIVYLKAQ